MEKLVAIMVVYNTNVLESRAYKCIKTAKNVRLIVCDNSTITNDNKRLVENDGNIYLCMHGNIGLSKAYNKAIDYIMDNLFEECDYIVLMDDDTYFPEEYFNELNKKISNSNIDIYLPVVFDETGNAGYLSPSIMKRGYCHRAKDIKSINKDELCGINSGMVIKNDIFDNYRYNEEIFLDYIDHNFIRDMRSRGKRIDILETKLTQCFSSSSDTKQSAEKRFKIFKKDINVFYKKGLSNRFLYHYILFRRRINLFERFRDLKVFFW